MRRSRAEAERWLRQAENDLAFAELGAREGFFAQACFVCQQAAEKALKAVHYSGGARFVFGHSLVELLDELVAGHPGFASLRERAQQLDQYYIPTRYPNGLPGGVPAEVFTRRQAEEAIISVREFMVQARAAIGPGPSP
jgi:HEPN domain-containing protein